MKQKLFYTATALGLLATASSVPANVIFDPDGPGGDAAITIGTLDWGPTSFLADNARVALGNFVGSGGDCSVTDCTFDILTHATLIGTLSPTNTLNTPSGVNSGTYEITMLLKYTETIASFNGTNFATFSSVPGEAAFLEIWYDDSPDSNALTGFGFDDGRLILAGAAVGDATGGFNITSTTPVALDQSTNGNQYPGQSTVTGAGFNTNIPFDDLTQDVSFFQTALTEFGINFANISIGLPYISVDPSDCFTLNASGVAVGGTQASGVCDNAHVNGPFSAQGPAPVGGVVPMTGAVNAGPIPNVPATEPDFVAQTDFNSPVTAAVPEPASLALVGMGLGLVGFAARRRKA